VNRRLPQPVSITDVYLAAVLEELRALNDTMKQLTQRASTAARADKPKSETSKKQ